MTKKRFESLRPNLKQNDKMTKFYAKLCMHVKITSVRSYEKLQCVETQTCKQILVMHAVVKLNLWMIEIPCVIIDVEMIYSVCDTDKRKE